MLVGLAFSGGGTRAAAFSFGVLQGMADTTFDDRGRAARLIDRIDFIRAVSGGSVSAAYSASSAAPRLPTSASVSSRATQRRR